MVALALEVAACASWTVGGFLLSPVVGCAVLGAVFLNFAVGASRRLPEDGDS